MYPTVAIIILSSSEAAVKLRDCISELDLPLQKTIDLWPFPEAFLALGYFADNPRKRRHFVMLLANWI
jgi:hypothetical protein